MEAILPSDDAMQAFARSIAALPYDAHDNRLALVAGALTLTIADAAVSGRRLDAGAGVIVERTIMRVGDLGRRMRLLHLLDAAAECAGAGETSIRLHALATNYGLELCDAQHFDASVVILAFAATSAPDHGLLLQARQHRARVLRIAGRYRESLAAFEWIVSDARHHERPAQLKARAGMASVYVELGELDTAAEILEAVAEQAHRERHNFIAAEAMGQRATIAGRMGKPAIAAMWASRALPGLVQEKEYYRCRAVLAQAKHEMGEIEEARTISVDLFQHATELEVRCEAGLRLFAIALDRSDIATADWANRWFIERGTALPPPVATELADLRQRLLVVDRGVRHASTRDIDIARAARPIIVGSVVASGASRR